MLSVKLKFAIGYVWWLTKLTDYIINYKYFWYVVSEIVILGIMLYYNMSTQVAYWAHLKNNMYDYLQDKFILKV